MGNTLSLDTPAEIGDALPKEDEYAEITYYDSSFDRYHPLYLASLLSNPSQLTLPVKLCTFLLFVGRSVNPNSCDTYSSSLVQLKESKF